jgi:serine/threonine-protein kinase 11
MTRRDPGRVHPFIKAIDPGRHGQRRIRKLNNYVLPEKIGTGSSCAVYRGMDISTNRTFAVKRFKLYELARSDDGIAQLEREIRLMRMFVHPNILRLYEVLHVRSCDEVFLILEYADKGSLGALIERGHQLSHSDIFSILKQVVGAIKHLHDAGYVHQDIKPCNILLDSTGRAILGDFGVGHSFESAGMVVGTPAYQAPEALDDSYASDEEAPEVPQKEDIWALGVTLYQLLFQRLPFLGSSLFEIVNTIREQPLMIPSGTDEVVEKLLRGMLMVDPTDRLGIDELLGHPLVRGAADRAAGLPLVPPPRAHEGMIVELVGEVIGEGVSISDLTMAVPRRSSYAAYDRQRRMARWPARGKKSNVLLRDSAESLSFRQPSESMDGASPPND